MKKTLQLAAIALPLAFILDGIWILIVAGDFYRSQIGTLLLMQPMWYAVVLFYILYSISLTVFVIQPAVMKDSLKHALMYGALLGFTTYMTYDLTNLSTLIGWTVPFAVVDTAWGTLMSALVAGGTYLIAKRFLK